MDQVFIIGFQRCGSTTLYGYLDQHPQICMAKPLRPEPKYFLNLNQQQLDLEYYEKKYFPDLNKQKKFIGEKSTSYIENFNSLKNIKSSYPQAKILVILREPVSRTFSNYKFSVKNGLEKLNFLEALSKEGSRTKPENISVSPYDYTRRSRYIIDIKKLHSIFNNENIKVILFEELIKSKNLIYKIWDWLKIDKFEVLDNDLFRNETDIDLCLDKETSLKLARGFLDDNIELSNFLNIDLSLWFEKSYYKNL